MLRKLLIVSLAVFTLAACSKDKDNDTPTYNLSAKIDGAATSFNTAVVAQLTGDAASGYSLYITSFGGTVSTPYPTFAIGISSDDPIAAKTYTATNDDLTGVYVAGAGFTHGSDTDFTLTITSISATEVAGTFSGKVEDGAGSVKTVTDGTFKAKVQ